jgi:hypothetical protein
MPHNDSIVGNSMGWHFGEYMGTAGDPIPYDSEQEVTSQFRVVHRTGDVVGKPIEIDSHMLRRSYLLTWSVENALDLRWRGVLPMLFTHR